MKQDTFKQGHLTIWRTPEDPVYRRHDHLSYRHHRLIHLQGQCEDHPRSTLGVA